MWIATNCGLLILGSIVFVLGVSFFSRNRTNAYGNTHYYILFLCLFSTMWCLSYGSIGITDHMDRAEILRIFGVLGFNAFIVVEVFLLSGMSGMKRNVSRVLRIVVIVIAIADFILYSNPKVDHFYRVGNWTTWTVNSGYFFPRVFHSCFVAVYFVILLSIGITWLIKNDLRRMKRFIGLLFVANFLMIFFAIPDTMLPMAGYPAVASSGYGSAFCTLVILYGATQLNTFNIRMGAISRILYEYINAGAIVFDMDHMIVMANPYAIKLSSKESIDGCQLTDLFDIDKGRTKRVFDQALNDQYTLRLTGNTTKKMYSVSINAAKDDFGDPYCYLCVFMDVSEEVRAIRELEVANNAKTEFLTSISHEIRTPINAIIGFNEMIVRDTDDEDIIMYANSADRASRQLLSIVNDLLDMGQITSGKMNLVEKDYDLGMLLRDVYDLQIPKAEEKNIEFNFACNENTPRYLVGDAVRIQQILTNLVTNAIKYTNKGSVMVFTGYRAIGEGDIDLILTVKDTGIGIKKEDLPYLYDTFTRFDKDTNKHIEGTGVGLSVTKNLIEMMGGIIEVESVYGEGTSFTATIPQTVSEQVPLGRFEEIKAKDNRGKTLAFVAPEANVLIVDDNEMNRMVFKGMVKPLMINADEAASGFEMHNMIRDKKYDVIFLDHMMPKMDGVETLKRMKEDGTHPNIDTPVIAMTANAGQGAKERYIGYGFDDYVAKPARTAEVFEMIRKYLPEDKVEDVDPDAYERINEAALDEDTENGVLPDVDGIDWKRACENIPERSNLINIIARFCALSDSDLSELDEYCNAIDSDEDVEMLLSYRVKVHSMKNSAALIGAVKLSSKAKELELAAEQNDSMSIKDHHEEFKKEYESVTEALRTKVLKNADTQKKLMDRDTLLDYIDGLDKAMAESDTMTLNEICLDLSEYEYGSDEMKEAVHKLSISVRDFDTDGFSLAIKEIRELLG